MNFCKTRIRRPRFEPRVSYDVPALCNAYGFPRVTPVKPGTIGIIELGGGYRPADIQAAFARWGLPAPQITDVSMGGSTNSPGGDADAEVVLDIEVAAAAYAYCTGKPAVVRVYFAPNTDQGFAAAVSQAAADGCATISISWGAPEDSWGSAISAFSQACAAAKAAGCTIFAAAGDNGSSDGERGDNVDYPASDPSVVGCGGTSKTATSEVVWSGTGGGYSEKFPRQAFQVGAPVGGGRMVPDVAANADPNTGYVIVLNGATEVIGGTSAVSPLYSGLCAALKAAGVSGDLLAAMWSHPAAFLDITSGSNGTKRAQSGPDPCTGLGVVRGAAILAALGGAAPPAPPPVVPPPPPVSPPPPPPILPPPVGKKGVIVIDLDAGTYSFPASFHPAADESLTLGDGKLLAVALDALRLYGDARAGNTLAVMMDVQQLLKDVGALLPTGVAA